MTNTNQEGIEDAMTNQNDNQPAGDRTEAAIRTIAAALQAQTGFVSRLRDDYVDAKHAAAVVTTLGGRPPRRGHGHRPVRPVGRHQLVGHRTGGHRSGGGGVHRHCRSLVPSVGRGSGWLRRTGNQRGAGVGSAMERGGQLGRRRVRTDQGLCRAVGETCVRKSSTLR